MVRRGIQSEVRNANKLKCSLTSHFHFCRLAAGHAAYFSATWKDLRVQRLSLSDPLQLSDSCQRCRWLLECADKPHYELLLYLDCPWWACLCFFKGLSDHESLQASSLDINPLFKDMQIHNAWNCATSSDHMIPRWHQQFAGSPTSVWLPSGCSPKTCMTLNGTSPVVNWWPDQPVSVGERVQPPPLCRDKAAFFIHAAQVGSFMKWLLKKI